MRSKHQQAPGSRRPRQNPHALPRTGPRSIRKDLTAYRLISPFFAEPEAYRPTRPSKRLAVRSAHGVALDRIDSGSSPPDACLLGLLGDTQIQRLTRQNARETEVARKVPLGLATGTALWVGPGRGAQLGLLIKDPEILESTRRVDTIVLDKTGTVTTGRMSLVEVIAAPSCAWARGRRRDPARAPHAAHDPGQPVLGLRLQRRGSAARGERAAQPDDRGRRHGVLVGLRRDQQPAPAAVPAGQVTRTNTGLEK